MALTRPPPRNHCDDPSTLLHTLDCEHVIKPPSSPPTPVCFPAPKSPCSSNCTRSIYSAKPQLPLAWLKRQENLHGHPFICPVCIEDRTRSQYPRYLEEHQKSRAASQKVTDDAETNVQLWTYGSVLEAAAQGGRICEAADEDGARSVFRIKYLEGFQALAQRRDAIELRKNMVKFREDARKEALATTREHDNRVYSDDTDMDYLADRLVDARIGVAQDNAVDDLAEGVSKM